MAGILDARRGLHAVGRGLVHGRGRSQHAVLEGLRTAREPPLLLVLGRKHSLLFLHTPLHYELMLEGAEGPGE